MTAGQVLTGMARRLAITVKNGYLIKRGKRPLYLPESQIRGRVRHGVLYTGGFCRIELRARFSAGFFRLMEPSLTDGVRWPRTQSAREELYLH